MDGGREGGKKSEEEVCILELCVISRLRNREAYTNTIKQYMRSIKALSSSTFPRITVSKKKDIRFYKTYSEDSCLQEK